MPLDVQLAGATYWICVAFLIINGVPLKEALLISAIPFVEFCLMLRAPAPLLWFFLLLATIFYISNTYGIWTLPWNIP